MKKIFLILALSACAFFAHSQTVPNWVINFGMNKDTVFSAPVGRTYNNYVWSVQVIMTVHSGDTLTGTVEIVSSNDGVHWERYSSSMIKKISAMTHSGLVYWVDFADYTCPQSFLGIRYTKNLTHRGTMNAIVNYKKL